MMVIRSGSMMALPVHVLRVALLRADLSVLHLSAAGDGGP